MKTKALYAITRKTLVQASLVTILAAAFVVYGRNSFRRTSESPPPDEILIVCPPYVQVGPASVPDGWQSLGNLSYPRRTITLDHKQHVAVCWYGQSNSFPLYLIAKPIPTGYTCKVLAGTESSFQAECHPATRTDRGNRSRSE